MNDDSAKERFKIFTEIQKNKDIDKMQHQVF